MFNITYRDKMKFVYCTLHISSYLVQFRVSIGMGRKHCVFWCYIDLWNNLNISLQVRVHFSDFEIAKRFGNTIFSFIYSNTFITYYTRMKERKLYWSFCIWFRFLSIFFIRRKMKKESEIHSNWWRITWDDLTWIAYANSEASSLGCSLAKAEHIL